MTKTNILILLYLTYIILINCIDYVPCPAKSEVETRELYVATCDTRTAWKEFHALKVWNVTGNNLSINLLSITLSIFLSINISITNQSNYLSGLQLAKQGVHMINACKGKNWGNHGYLSKPLYYLGIYISMYLSNYASNYLSNYLNIYQLDFLRSLPKKSALGGDVHVILMDSDTFWASSNLSEIWQKYDCTRGSKHAVLSTEMSCWVGRYCTIEDVNRWLVFYVSISLSISNLSIYRYDKPHLIPSYSPFANSGIVMASYLSISIYLYLFIYLFIYLSLSISIYLYIYLSVR
jgi:hypothetical protein